MNSLCIDIGNTRIKVAIFAQNKLREVKNYEILGNSELEELLIINSITHSIISSVRKEDFAFTEILKQKTKFLALDHYTKLPFINCYASPETLGIDRVALAAAAINLFDKEHCLIIDVGTCITYDFVNNKQEYLGGAISPGIGLRLKSMNSFTGKLPLLNFEPVEAFLGKDTKSSMLSGVFYGILSEIEGTIDLYKKEFGNINVVLSGGDSLKFEKHLKNGIFANPNLVLWGLNKILLYNA